jgi:uncharacterized protein (TIGR02246 family)
MKRLLIYSIVLFLGLSTVAQPQLSEKEKTEVGRLLEAQAEAWNAGNLENFMETYWKSDELAFVGGDGPTYGWDATLERYKKSYPNKDAMGHLEFKILKITKIDTKTVLLIGRYELTRVIGNAAGHFTLVIQNTDGEWKIISDHSSAEN